MSERSAQAPGSSRRLQGFSLIKSVLSLTKLVIIAGIILVCLVPLIYLHGSDTPHQIDQHPLYGIFEGPVYQQLEKELNKKTSNRVILQGNFEGGLRHFVTHYANKLTQKQKHVVLQEINPEDIPIRPYVKEAKYFIEQRLDIEPNMPRVWIIISQKEFPLLEVNLVLTRHPLDRIIVASSAQNQFQASFKRIAYPSITPEKFQDQMAESLEINPSVVDIIYDHFGSIQTIFNLTDNNSEALKPEKLLGEHLRSIDLLSESDQIILQNICKNGEGTAVKRSKTLDAFGCVFYQKKYYWDHDLARLNYELSKKINCQPDGVISGQLRSKMYQQTRKQEEERMKKKTTEERPKKPKEKQSVEKEQTQQPKNVQQTKKAAKNQGAKPSKKKQAAKK